MQSFPPEYNSCINGLQFMLLAISFCLHESWPYSWMWQWKNPDSVYNTDWCVNIRNSDYAATYLSLTLMYNQPARASLENLDVKLGWWPMFKGRIAVRRGRFMSKCDKITDIEDQIKSAGYFMNLLSLYIHRWCSTIHNKLFINSEWD